MRVGVTLLLALWLGGAAAAQTHVLRIATSAPEGTSWAHELHGFQREIERATHGAVTLKLILGGLAGDEFEALERIRRGQLDALAGGAVCEKVVPTMRVLGLPALFQTRGEAQHVLNLLRGQSEQEAHAAGFELLGVTGLGPSVVFSRRPIRTLDELRETRLWTWNVDAASTSLGAMGLKVVPTRIEDAAAAYDRGAIDGFHAIPAAALAFQWTTRAHYLTDLRVRFLSGCVLIAARAFDALPFDVQQMLRTAAAQLSRRMDSLGADMDEQLLGGLLVKQGMIRVPPTDPLRAEFFAAARKARPEMVRALAVDPALVEKVQSLLADYRAEHPH